MANYFVVASDTGLLPPAIRTNADLANVAAEAEKDVIEHYTDRVRPTWYTARVNTVSENVGELVNSSLGLYVYLRGYKKDANDAAVDADLKDALKREIAGVIAWRLAKRDVNTLTLSEADGSGKSLSLHQSVMSDFPPGFGKKLRRFDTREPAWGM